MKEEMASNMNKSLEEIRGVKAEITIRERVDIDRIMKMLDSNKREKNE